jgi:hypothetical protein
MKVNPIGAPLRENSNRKIRGKLSVTDPEGRGRDFKFSND